MSPDPSYSYRVTVLRVVGMLLATGVLFFFTRVVSPAPCWGLFMLLALISWPIWRYRVEYLLFRRRLVLAGVALPESRIRAWLWRGNVTKGIQVIVSLFLAWVLLALVSQLSPQHWYVLTADAVFLALIAGPVARRLTAEINPGHRGAVARRWPLFLINSVVLTAAIMTLDYTVVGAVDTRHMDWHQVAEQAFTKIIGEADCVLWGVSAGGLAAVEALSWHGSTLVIPNLPDATARAIAWSFFLLRAGTVAWLFTALLLGVSVLLENRKTTREGRTSGSTISRAFFVTIIVLALPYFYAAMKLNEIDYSVLEKGVGSVARLIDPCKPDEASRERLLAKLDGKVEQQRKQAVQDIDTGLDSGLEGIFMDVEEGVDSYLDWYFTVIGEYQRLAAAFTEDVTAVMRDQLEEHLFVHSDFDNRLQQLDRTVEQASAERFTAVVPHIHAEVDNSPCGVGKVDVAPLMDLDHDKFHASAAATTGVAAGILASKALAKKTTAAVVGKVAAKKSFQAGAAVATKTLAKKGTSSLLAAGVGTTVCAPTGPVAILCGVTAGLVTWLTVDKVLIELDEVINREEMRQDILKVLADQKVELGMELKEKHYAQADHMAVQVNTAVEKMFVPSRDGVKF